MYRSQTPLLSDDDSQSSLGLDDRHVTHGARLCPGGLTDALSAGHLLQAWRPRASFWVTGPRRASFMKASVLRPLLGIPSSLTEATALQCIGDRDVPQRQPASCREAPCLGHQDTDEDLLAS